MQNKLGLTLVDWYRASRLREHTELVNRSQYWSEEEISDYQNIRLRELIGHAYENTKYYKKLFDEHAISPGSIQTVDDLKAVPVLTKKLLRENLDDLVAINASKFKPQKRRTGGTTGKPLTHYSDINTWSLHWALKMRAWSWAGYEWGAKIGVLAGSSLVPNTAPSLTRRMWNRVNNFYPMSAVHLDPDTLTRWLDLIEKENIRQLRGYPSSIFCLASHALETSRNIRLTGVFTTAEVLLPHHKKTIQEAFKTTVIDSYGCADGGGNASTCEHDSGFHISIEASVLELTNGSGELVEPGKMGEVTLTSLTNFAMPTIRYKPEDMAIAKTEKCACGRHLPMLEKIVGRTTDVLAFENGRMIGGPALTLLFREFPIEQYQLVQNSKSTLDVYIVVNESFDSSDKFKLGEILAHHCGDDVNIDFHEVSEIQTPASGKFRFVINNTNR